VTLKTGERMLKM